MPLEKDQFMAKIKMDTLTILVWVGWAVAALLLIAYIVSTIRGCQESRFRSEVEIECVQRGPSCSDVCKSEKPREK